MTMYERDPNFEDAFTVGDRFVVTAMVYEGQINTKFGPAEKTRISIVTQDGYPETVTYSVIGAGFANLARRASAEDFPHVAEFIHVPLGDNKHVKRLAPVDVDPKAFVEGDNGPEIDLDSFAPKPGTGNGGADAGPGF